MTRPDRSLRRLLARAATLLPRWPGRGDRFHFVRDYRRLVRGLIARYPIDEAMSRAVGGDWEAVGGRLADVMQEAGLTDGMSLLDLGCGSGRLAHALSRRVRIDYLGLDVIPELLAYARTRCPPDYRFQLNRALTLPVSDESFDVLCAFSVLTHLLHQESFLYLREAHRVLRPGGRAVVSFLELGGRRHLPLFLKTVAATAAEGPNGPLDVFIEEEALTIWAAEIGFEPPVFTRFGEAGAAGALGQSVAVMTKPVRAVTTRS